MSETKKCTKCGEEKPATLDYWNRKKAGRYGLTSICKPCIKSSNEQYYLKNKETINKRNKQYRDSHKEYNKEYQEKYRAENKEKIKMYHQKHYEDNKERILDNSKKYYDENKEKVNKRISLWQKRNKDKTREHTRNWRINNPEKSRLQRKKAYESIGREKNALKMKEYRLKHPEKIKEIQKRSIAKRYSTDVTFRMISNIRRRIRQSIKSDSISKATLELLGCTPDECRAYIESLFLPGMSWENYGHKTWHIDHKIPCAAFDLSDPEQQKKCFHYTNLQPLWAEDNLKKGAKILTDQTASK